MAAESWIRKLEGNVPDTFGRCCCIYEWKMCAETDTDWNNACRGVRDRGSIKSLKEASVSGFPPIFILMHLMYSSHKPVANGMTT